MYLIFYKFVYHAKTLQSISLIHQTSAKNNQTFMELIQIEIQDLKHTHCQFTVIVGLPIYIYIYGYSSKSVLLENHLQVVLSTISSYRIQVFPDPRHPDPVRKYTPILKLVFVFGLLISFLYGLRKEVKLSFLIFDFEAWQFNFGSITFYARKS